MPDAAECRVGAALRARPRGEVVPATRVGRLLRRDAPADPDQQILAGAPPQNPRDRLRSEGPIAAVGAGLNRAGTLARFARVAHFDCFLLAGRFTLLDQSGLDELLPASAA